MLGVRFDNVDDGGRIVAFTSSHHHEVTKNSDGTVLITLSCCKCKKHRKIFIHSLHMHNLFYK